MTIRVLHVLDVLRPSGAETCLRIAGDMWADLDIDCDVLATGDELGPYAAPLHRAGYRTAHLPLDPFTDFARTFLRLLRTERYDVVHIHIERANFYVAALARFAGARVVQHVHNVFAFDGAHGLERRVQRNLMRAAGIPFLAVSDDVVENERDRFHIDATTFLNWADLERYQPDAAARGPAREALGIPAEAFVLVSVANCHDFKNHLTMVRAMAQLDDGVRWLHVGSGGLEEEEQALARELGVEKRISFLGQRDPLQALRAADLFVMNSHYEGQGISAIEALASGLPAVLSDVPGLRNLGDMGVPARWCGTDAESLAAAIDASRAAPPTGTLDVLRSTFSPDARVPALARVYRDVTGDRPATASEALPSTVLPDAPMRVGMISPLYTEPLLPHLDADPSTVPPGIGGPTPTDLTVSLIRAGHHVSVITMDSTVDRPVRFTGPQLDLRIVPMRPIHRGRDAYRPERLAMQAELATMDLDIVHAHWSYEFAMVAEHARVPHLVTVHDWAPLVVKYNPIPYWWAKLAMNAKVFAGRPPMTTPSPSVHRRLRAIGFRNVRLIPNGLRLDATGLSDPRSQLGSPATLLSVTNEFSGRKNTATLLRAFDIVRRRYPGTTLRLIGADHGPGEKAEEWAAEHGLTSGVTFLGMQSREDVLREMREADLLVHPAREEPFGLVIIEAMSQGLPIVGGEQSGGVPYILDDGAFGILVDVDRAEHIAAGVFRYLDNPEDYVRFSALGLQRVADAFDNHRITDTYVEAYRDLLAGTW
ncbi:glycosyltransferase [Euzebya rosea]|uniref:glycosyltransferase n=1 Tax=Euzebya rosea TaxID=2052804 RepID=UPI0014753946|nr:glycosyltransferase [Euzebya rosea]